MTYDEKVPSLLKREQQWFGSIIGRPIDEDSRMNPVSPSGQLMEEEASEHILPSPTLRPAQRIQIYNQQYWWRLLNTLHESFPLLTRLFGHFDFNRTIGIPYLAKYPPRHWSLSLLGDRLPQWLEEDYFADDKQLIINAAALDLAFSSSFLASAIEPIKVAQVSTEDAVAEVFNKPVYLQPFIHLFEFEYDLFKYRIDFLEQNPDHWVQNDFPVLDRSRTFHFALYRNKRNDISWKEISSGEYLILSMFQKGTSIDKVCEELEQLEPALYETAAQNLHIWFQEWTQREWLSFENPQKPLPN